MTNKELNLYIQHYIEKDKTGRAIMLTGAWGTGKSYYIKKDLVPYLAKTENGAHSCIVVSLYGLNNTSEISKAIYLEARLKGIKDKIETEAGKATVLVAKTLLKGVTSFFGIDLNTDENSLEGLYQSIDLSGKLIVLEDVERSNIHILEILGFVNNLVEQDNVKVMLVANEDEIMKYDYVEKSEKEKTQTDIVVGHKQSGSILIKRCTKDTIRYLETKEKSIGDTIRFEGNPEAAIVEIIKSFDNKKLQQFATSECAEDIAALMFISSSKNLRSIIYACQKTEDILDRIETDIYSDDFVETIFYGIIAFSLRMHAGNDNRWVGLESYSQELGIQSHPLFRFCYDYIMTQQLDESLIPVANEALRRLRLYDPNKTSKDSDLRTIARFYTHTEAEVKHAVVCITARLKDINDISFSDYGLIATALVTLKYALGVDIDEAKKLLIDNLKGRADHIHENDLFFSTINSDNEEGRKEFIQLREEMIRSLHNGEGTILGFDYLPEQASLLYDYTEKKTGSVYEARGFAKYLDVPRFVKMFLHATPAQMEDIRKAFVSLYRQGSLLDRLRDDLPAIEQIVGQCKTVGISQVRA